MDVLDDGWNLLKLPAELNVFFGLYKTIDMSSATSG
jgi:hypothetical protein